VQVVLYNSMLLYRTACIVSALSRLWLARFLQQLQTRTKRSTFLSSFGLPLIFCIPHTASVSSYFSGPSFSSFAFSPCSFDPAFSSVAFSTPAFSSSIFHFLFPHFQRSRAHINKCRNSARITGETGDLPLRQWTPLIHGVEVSALSAL